MLNTSEWIAFSCVVPFETLFVFGLLKRCRSYRVGSPFRENCTVLIWWLFIAIENWRLLEMCGIFDRGFFVYLFVLFSVYNEEKVQCLWWFCHDFQAASIEITLHGEYQAYCCFSLNFFSHLGKWKMNVVIDRACF